MSDTPGWDAITDACTAIDGAREPKHFGTVVKWRMGGPYPLDGTSVYASEHDRPHWHFVTYGLSELYTKETDDPAWSGWGLELTFRLARDPGEREPPAWALSFLQNLARYVVESGNVFQPAHHMNLDGPIALDEGTDVCAVLFAEDPQLGTIETPHGRVRFVQVVGVTEPDYEAALAWKTLGVLAVLARASPCLVTDLWRAPLVSDPSCAAEIERGIAAEGSSTSALNVDTLALGTERGVTTLVIGASAAARVAKLVRGRLGHRLPLELVGGTPRTSVTLAIAAQSGIDAQTLSLSPEDAERIAASLGPTRGMRAWPEIPCVRVDVRPSEIRDQGGRVVRVVG